MVINKNNPIRVFVVHPGGELLAKRLQNEFPFADVDFYPTHNVSDISHSAWAECEVLYTERALPLPELVPELEWIQFHYAGIDKHVNHPLLAKPNLIITTLSGVSALPIGEYVVSYILAFCHRIFEMKELQKQRIWPDNRFDALFPYEIRKSTVGIVGYGSTGREVARIVKAFGARVVATKRNSSSLIDQGFFQDGTGDPDGRYLDRVYPLDQLCEMLSVSDFVVVSLPLTDHTRNLIGKKQLWSMKRNSLLIDVSRGGIVDQDALIDVLTDGHLAGSVLDVFPKEPLPSTSPLWDIPNLTITPHISGYSNSYFEQAYYLFVKNFHLFLEGKPLFNQFNKVQGY